MKLWDNARTGPSSWASLAIWGSGQPTRVVEPEDLEPVTHQGRTLHLLEVDVCPDQGLRGTVVLPLKKGFDDHRGGPGVDAMKEVRLKPVPRRGFCRKKPNCWLATDDGRAPRFDRTARFDDLPRTDLGFLDAFQRAATNDEVLLPAPHAWFTREPTIVPLLQPLVQCTSPKTGTTSLVVVRPNACDEQHARRFALRLPAPDPEHRFSIAVVTPRDDDRACDAQQGWSFDPDRLLAPEPLRESALEFPPCVDLPRGNWQPLTPVTDPAKLPYREALRGEIRTALLTGDAVVLTAPAERKTDRLLLTTPHRCIDPAGRVRVWWPEGHVTRYDDPQCPPKRQMREEVHAFRVPPGRPVLGLGTVVTERKATCHPPPEPKQPCDHPWCHCPGGRCVNEGDDARFPDENR